MDNEYTVTASVENTGDVAGAEVVQVYVHDDSAKVLRPAKELKAFAKVFLQPKEKKSVELHLNTGFLCILRRCRPPMGDFERNVRNSCRHILARSSDQGDDTVEVSSSLSPNGAAVPVVQNERS